MKTLSICLISNDFPPNLVGGQGVYAYEIAKRLSKKGHNVKVIASTNDNLKNEEFELYPIKRTKNPLYFSFLVRKIFLKNIHENIDILHGNALDHLFLCIKKPKNIDKIVTTTHNSYLQRFYAKSLWWKVVYPSFLILERVICNHSNKIIAVSNTTKDVLFKHNIPNSKIDVIYNGVDVERFNPKIKCGFLRGKLNLSESDQIVLFVSRLVRRKNPYILLMVCKELIKQSPNIHCVFVGKGTLETKLRKLANNYKISKNTHFLGFISSEELPKIYSDSNVFVLPSAGEGKTHLNFL